MMCFSKVFDLWNCFCTFTLRIMKEKISAIIFFLSVCVICHGQEKGFAFGPVVKAGMGQILYNRTDTVNIIDVKSKLKFSYQAGIFAGYRFTNSFSIAAEVNYWGQSGALIGEATVNDTLNNTLTEETTKDIIHLSYTAFPLYVMFHLRNASILLGGQAAVSINQSGKRIFSSSINGVQQPDVTTNPEPAYVNYDYGGKAGIHYQISDRLDAGIEYYLGRTNLTHGSSEVYNAHNQNFYAAIRYNIVTHANKDKVNGFYRD